MNNPFSLLSKSRLTRGRAGWTLVFWLTTTMGAANLMAGYPNNINDAEDEFVLQFGEPTATGVTEWYVSQPYINLWLVNKPLTYYTALGKAVGFTAAFKQRNTRYAPEMPGLGPGWKHSALSYITYSFGYPSLPCTLYVGLGGSRTYVPDGVTKEIKTGSTMTRLTDQYGTSGFEIDFPSGAKQRFLFGADGARKYLSEDIDPNGRVTRYEYNVYGRLTNVWDPDSNWLSLYYYSNDGTNFDWQIKEVVDRYNKRATFSYETTYPYRLVQIVNSGNLTNTFRYDSQGFITNAVTVYGTNVFKATANVSHTRSGYQPVLPVHCR